MDVHGGFIGNLCCEAAGLARPLEDAFEEPPPQVRTESRVKPVTRRSLAVTQNSGSNTAIQPYKVQ